MAMTYYKVEHVHDVQDKDPKDNPPSSLAKSVNFWLMLMGVAVALIMPITEWMSTNGIQLQHSIFTYVGMCVMVCGILLRQWALISHYTNSVMNEKRQLIQQGPYKHLRHPVYAGLFVAVFGFAITLESWISLPIVVVVMCLILARRIREEEQLLSKQYGELFEKYKRYTWRLIPGIW